MEVADVPCDRCTRRHLAPQASHHWAHKPGLAPLVRETARTTAKPSEPAGGPVRSRLLYAEERYVTSPIYADFLRVTT